MVLTNLATTERRRRAILRRGGLAAVIALVLGSNFDLQAQTRGAEGFGLREGRSSLKSRKTFSFHLGRDPCLIFGAQVSACALLRPCRWPPAGRL
jgi:hypothetical protein